MAFTEANYAIIMSTTAKLGINCAYLINYLISNVNTDELKTYADSQLYAMATTLLEEK